MLLARSMIVHTVNSSLHLNSYHAFMSLVWEKGEGKKAVKERQYLGENDLLVNYSETGQQFVRHFDRCIVPNEAVVIIAFAAKFRSRSGI